jgi:hypothetical protein
MMRRLFFAGGLRGVFPNADRLGNIESVVLRAFEPGGCCIGLRLSRLSRKYLSMI